MIENYDELTVDETLDVVSEFDDEKTEQFIKYERNHKDRTTVIEPLEKSLPNKADPSTDEPEMVTVTVETGNYGGGVFFDDATESKTVELTTRIEQALEDGNLTEVE